MKTRTELIHRALRNLGALPQGQTPSIEESDSIDDLINVTLEELNAREITWISDFENFDERYFLSLAHCLAWKAAPEFGQGNDAALAAFNQKAELDLKDMFNIIDRDYVHSRRMRSDYPIRRCVSTNLSNST